MDTIWRGVHAAGFLELVSICWLLHGIVPIVASPAAGPALIGARSDAACSPWCSRHAIVSHAARARRMHARVLRMATAGCAAPSPAAAAAADAVELVQAGFEPTARALAWVRLFHST